MRPPPRIAGSPPWRRFARAALVLALCAQWAAAARGADEYTLTLPAGGKPAAGGGTLRLIGNATVLIQYQGLTVLTDPNFLPRGGSVHLGWGLSSERLTAPAAQLAELPRVDLVVLSHLHEDHFDRLVQANLRRDVPIVTTKEAAARLEKLGFTQRYALSRWDSLSVRKGAAQLRITALPARHGPRALAWLLPEVMGTMLDFSAGPLGTAYRIYISGDTLPYDRLAQIPARFPDIDLALLHLGGMHLLGIKVSMDAADGVRMLRLLAPQRAIPLHADDYAMFKSPLSDFRRAVSEAGLAPRVLFLERGETYVLPAGDGANAPAAAAREKVLK
jgi:L-ascorbate metabolism protein UlaG (beta-lactamase superfamily)